MAGNKMNTKSKSKEEKGKVNKTLNHCAEENEEHDFSILRKPIYTSITGLAQARKIFDCATEELKGLLSTECDLLYECKVCRNIFRSLANFISHKRVYCKETFNSSQHSHFINPTTMANEISKIKRTEEGYQQSLKEKHPPGDNDMDVDDDDRIPLTKDLTTIMEKIAKNRGVSQTNNEQNVVLQKIANSSVAVFQSVNFTEEKQFDKMRAQVNELDNILSRDKAVLQKDGKFKTQVSVPTDNDNVIQISDDEENDYTGSLKCKVCDQQFSTQKTLKFHMKYKHLESRLVYPCPDCLEIFSTSWSVYRHLFKVHRKTAAQIKKLRESIQAKAFKMNNPPAFYEKRKNVKPTPVQKITEEERLDQENQAWMDNMEGEGETPRCFGCGRTFERRAALAAHTHTCGPRGRALARRPPDAKKIEIQIRKDYNKGPPAPLRFSINTTDANENKIAIEETSLKTIKNEEKVRTSPQKEKEEKEESIPNKTMAEEQNSNIKSDSSENIEKGKSLPISKISKLPFALQPEKSNLAAFKLKIQPDVDSFKNLCKRCDTQYNDVQELYEHMATHYKWMRYACKLCNFKNYDFNKLPEHVKTVHKLKGDNDFYYSTVKALDGPEALELSEPMDEVNENNESPDSRRPSRCSSDSSRLSDDSSSSSTRVEAGCRKRKMNPGRSSSKRKKESLVNDDDDEMKNDVPVDKEATITENDSSIIKTFEENSSDMDDVDEKIAKKQIELMSSVASRRPIRKKTKPKYEDFEYDLSNLLKMEAQGYRDSQLVANAKSSQSKKKTIQQENQIYDNLNKDCYGALAMLSKKAVAKAAAHMKTTNFSSTLQKDIRSGNTFVRPMNPKTFSKCDKISPKKDIENSKDCSSPNKETNLNKETIRNKEINLNKETIPSKEINPNKEISLNKETNPNEEINSNKEINLNKETNTDKEINTNKEINQNKETTLNNETNLNKESKSIKSPDSERSIKKNNLEAFSCSKKDEVESLSNSEVNASSNSSKEDKPIKNTVCETVKANLNNIPSIVPIKFRRQSLEVMKNPLINKNLTDFTKAGMKTKILVIKPINRNKDGITSSGSPLKFQTIKLKDPTKSSTSKEKKSDQIVVVKVPKVECTSKKPDSSDNEKNSNTMKSNNDNDTEKQNNINDESDQVKSNESINDNITCVQDKKEIKSDPDIVTNDDKDISSQEEIATDVST